MDFDVISPETTSELLTTMAECQETNFRFGAGYTDLLMELKKQPEVDLTVINLRRLHDELFTGITETMEGLRIGALTTADQITRNEKINNDFPVLQQSADKLASRQIRHVATVGGNICTASPAGDVACALVALQARCEVIDTEGNLRTEPISEFLTGVRTTSLKRNELLRSILIPANETDAEVHSGFIKVGTRRSMECSVVSLASHIQTDSSGKVIKAAVAAGSVAPTIIFAETACEILVGKKLSELEKENVERFAECVLSYASPISDIRGSAWYRKEVLFNISKSILENL